MNPCHLVAGLKSRLIFNVQPFKPSQHLTRVGHDVAVGHNTHDSILGLLKLVHDLFFSQYDLQQVEHLTHQHRLGCEVHHLHRGQLSQLAQVEEAIVHLLGDFYGLRVERHLVIHPDAH